MNSSSHGGVNSSSHGDQVNSSSPSAVNSSSHELDAVKDSYLDAKEQKDPAPEKTDADEVLSHRQNQISEPEIAVVPSKKPVEPTPKEIDAWIAAWIQNLPAPPLQNQYGRKVNRTSAKALIKAGYTYENMAAYMASLYHDPFWEGKVIQLGYIADHMPAWLKGTPKANATPPRPSPAPPPRASSPGAPNLRAREASERKAAAS